MTPSANPQQASAVEQLKRLDFSQDQINKMNLSTNHGRVNVVESLEKHWLILTEELKFDKEELTAIVSRHAPQETVEVLSKVGLTLIAKGFEKEQLLRILKYHNNREALIIIAEPNFDFCGFNTEQITDICACSGGWSNLSTLQTITNTLKEKGFTYDEITKVVKYNKGFEFAGLIVRHYHFLTQELKLLPSQIANLPKIKDNTIRFGKINALVSHGKKLKNFGFIGKQFISIISSNYFHDKIEAILEVFSKHELTNLTTDQLKSLSKLLVDLMKIKGELNESQIAMLEQHCMTIGMHVTNVVVMQPAVYMSSPNTEETEDDTSDDEKQIQESLMQPAVNMPSRDTEETESDMSDDEVLTSGGKRKAPGLFQQDYDPRLFSNPQPSKKPKNMGPEMTTPVPATKEQPSRGK